MQKLLTAIEKYIALPKTRAEAEEWMLLWTFVLFFCNDPVFHVADFIFGFFGEAVSTIVASVVIYAPLAFVLVQRAQRGEGFKGWAFVVVYLALVILFALSLALHPEYASAMFDWDWDYNVLESVFNPTCAVFSLFVLVVADDSRLIIKGLAIVAFLNFAYNLAKLALGLYQGGWEAHIASGEVVKKSYSLGLGYSLLFSTLIFMLLAFRDAAHRLLYAVFTAAGFVCILIGGSRAPLGIVAIALVVFAAYYGFAALRENPRLKTLSIRIVIGVAIAVALSVVFFNQVVSVLVALLDAVGLSSRSLNTLLSGSFLSDNGRDKIYALATELIDEGPFFGYGMYGDRYYLMESVYWGYAHNIVYEFQLIFGKVPGVVMLLVLAAFVVYSLLKGRNRDYRELTILFLMLCVQLFLSNSFLIAQCFWCLVGVVYLQVKPLILERVDRRRVMSGVAQRKSSSRS